MLYRATHLLADLGWVDFGGLWSTQPRFARRCVTLYLSLTLRLVSFTEVSFPALLLRLRHIVTCIRPNQNNQPNLDLYLVRRYKICHFPIVVSYLCIGQNLKNQPNLVLYLVRRYKIFVSVATLSTLKGTRSSTPSQSLETTTLTRCESTSTWKRPRAASTRSISKTTAAWRSWCTQLGRANSRWGFYCERCIYSFLSWLRKKVKNVILQLYLQQVWFIRDAGKFWLVLSLKFLQIPTSLSYPFPHPLKIFLQYACHINSWQECW